MSENLGRIIIIIYFGGGWGRRVASLRRRLNLISVGNVCEVAPKSLFGAPNGTQPITGNGFRISFHPDWPVDNGFLTGQWRGAYSNPGTQVGAENKDFGAVSQTDLVSSLA